MLTKMYKKNWICKIIYLKIIEETFFWQIDLPYLLILFYRKIDTHMTKLIKYKTFSKRTS